MQITTRQEPSGAPSQLNLLRSTRIVVLSVSLGLWLPVCLAPAHAAGGLTNEVRFRTPHEVRYRFEEPASQKAVGSTRDNWMRAVPSDGSTNFVEFGSRVVLQLGNAAELKRALEGRPLTIARRLDSNVFVLQAPDAATAALEAERLAGLPGVVASYPVTRSLAELHGRYASMPSDIDFFYCWQLEHRLSNGNSAGLDLNTRAAWPYTTGQGVTVAVADTGVELTHPELLTNVIGQPHYSFLLQTNNGLPVDRLAEGAHGTEVAGLIAADLNHARIVGVAPEAGLASWVVVDTNELLASDELLMEMYQYQSNAVGVQNFSWGHAGLAQNPISLLEDIGISNAINFGRSGRGVVMVRSAGNDRTTGGNANDDGYRADPRVITVGAVRIDGRVTSYSDPGACLLVGAPSGDSDTDPTGLMTTDLLGPDGVNYFYFLPPNQDLSDYVFNNLAFSGTSASAPLVAGVAALLLSVNPSLTYRDVQQILILSSRHFDFADPDLSTNGAGFRVSHNLGFGVPDAGAAVNLARNWPNRPPSTLISLTSSLAAPISSQGLRVVVTGPGVPPALASIPALPSTGPQADTPTPLLPLADFGFGTGTNGFNLSGQGALIQRGSNTFSAKINLAAQAGSAFAVIYNFLTNSSGSGAPGGETLVPMAGTDFVPIPAVFIGYDEGSALVQMLATNNQATAQIYMPSTTYSFVVTNTLICEHVQVRVMTTFPLRGDLRITLVSPAGTRSVLQRYNGDTSPGPTDWTYYSTHHFFESSAGTWTVFISNQGAEGFTGTVNLVSLNIEGVPIEDIDHDGLDDNWERRYFSNLSQGPSDDSDRDGYSNMREQLMGTDPTRNNNLPFRVDLSQWNASISRLSWPSSTDFTFEIWGGSNPGSLSLITNLPGQFPETEWLVPSAGAAQFFQVRATANP